MSAEGFPVVIAANGIGVPVISVTDNAPLATVAANGFGLPIVLVTQYGTPLVISNLPSSSNAILREDSGYILREDGGKIVREQ